MPVHTYTNELNSLFNIIWDNQDDEGVDKARIPAFLKTAIEATGGNIEAVKIITDITIAMTRIINDFYDGKNTPHQLMIRYGQHFDAEHFEAIDRAFAQVFAGIVKRA